MVFCLEMATVDENGVSLASGLLGEMELKETALVAGQDATETIIKLLKM